MTKTLVRIEEAAEQLGVPIATMYDWRYRNLGPRSAKMGNRIVYRQADLDAWVEKLFAEGRGEVVEAAGA